MFQRASGRLPRRGRIASQGRRHRRGAGRSSGTARRRRLPGGSRRKCAVRPRRGSGGGLSHGAREGRRRERCAAPAQAQPRSMPKSTRPSRCSAPASLVRTSAPDVSSGCPTSMSPLPVRMATSGCGRRSQALSELCVFRGCGRKDPVWPPGPSWACAKHSGADEHGVRERAQQTHHEPIRVAVPGDELVRARHRRNRDGAVDGRDEVGVHAVLGEPQIAVVESRELRRQRRVAEARPLRTGARAARGTRVRPRRERTRTGLRRQAWKRSPSTTLSTVLRSARNAMPTRSSSSPAPSRPRRGSPRRARSRRDPPCRSPWTRLARARARRLGEAPERQPGTRAQAARTSAGTRFRTRRGTARRRGRAPFRRCR